MLHAMDFRLLEVTDSDLVRGHGRCKGNLYPRGVGITSYIWHSADVRAEWPPFSALPDI